MGALGGGWLTYCFMHCIHYLSRGEICQANFIPPQNGVCLDCLIRNYFFWCKKDESRLTKYTLKIALNQYCFNFKWEMANYDDTSPDELGKTINRYKWTLFILNVIAFIASIATFAVCIWIRYNIFFCAISFL